MLRAKYLEQFVKAWYYNSAVHACVFTKALQGGLDGGLKETNFGEENAVQNQGLGPKSGKWDIQDPRAYQYASKLFWNRCSTEGAL